MNVNFLNQQQSRNAKVQMSVIIPTKQRPTLSKSPTNRYFSTMEMLIYLPLFIPNFNPRIYPKEFFVCMKPYIAYVCTPTQPRDFVLTNTIYHCLKKNILENHFAEHDVCITLFSFFMSYLWQTGRPQGMFFL